MTIREQYYCCRVIPFSFLTLQGSQRHQSGWRLGWNTTPWSLESYLAPALSSRSVHLSARLWSWVRIFSRSRVSAVAAILSPSARIICTVGRRSSNNLWSSWRKRNADLLVQTKEANLDSRGQCAIRCYEVIWDLREPFIYIVMNRYVRNHVNIFDASYKSERLSFVTYVLLI